MLKRNYVCMFTGVGIVNPSRMARFTCSFSYTTMRHFGGTRARCLAGCRGMSQRAAELWTFSFFFQRSRLCVCDVRPWKGRVELKRPELAAATVAPAVMHRFGRRVRKVAP
jgi:hypothetical protein